jgi:hypothetical protein
VHLSNTPLIENGLIREIIRVEKNFHKEELYSFNIVSIIRVKYLRKNCKEIKGLRIFVGKTWNKEKA